MKNSIWKMSLFITASLLLVIALSGGCAPRGDLDSHLNSMVKAYRFSIVSWEFSTLLGGGKQPIQQGEIKDESSQVTAYFSLSEQISALKSEIEAINTNDKPGDPTPLEAELNRLEGQRAALEEVVARIITRQIRATLVEQGIFHPMDKHVKLRFGFPPVNFRLEPPPHLLIVSPRDRIESIREVMLIQELSLEEMEGIEAEVDKLGVSSLVAKLGGFGGTYPTFVASDTSLQVTIDTATEEWLHQYLVFKPLGFLYLLDLIGVSRNYDIATMNETVASMVSKEIGTLVYEKYYPQHEGVNRYALLLAYMSGMAGLLLSPLRL
ncbi:hypothetical protein ES703_46647 [subsurface metagenome]